MPERLDAAKVARLRLALTAGAEELYPLLQDADPDVLRNTLKNPQFSEEHLLALLKRKSLPEQLMNAIGKLPLIGGSRRLLIALAAHQDTPPPLLSSLLPRLFLFELVNLMQIPGTPADLKVAAERAILRRLPETELGNKITLARRGSPAILEALIRGGEPRLVEAVLANPKLRESGVHAFVSGPSASAETISAVARHPVWGSRPNIRFAMLRNPKTPVVWFTLFLPNISGGDVRGLLHSRALTSAQLNAVRQEARRRGLAS